MTELSSIVRPTAQQTHTKVMLCTLVFQTLSGYKWNQDTVDAVKKVINGNNLWANYCIARAAVRYGHHKIAFGIVKELTEQVSSEHLYFWLVCLMEMSEAEAELADEDGNLVERLDAAIVHYNKGLAALKVGNTFICLPKL